MDSLWDLDVRNAVELIRTANECAEVFSFKTDAEDRQKYGTIIRAKLSSLGKTIGNMERSLREVASGQPQAPELASRKRELENLKQSQLRLQQVLSNPGAHTSLPEPQTQSPKPDLQQMSRTELYDHRNMMMRMQEDELGMLDHTAGAIQSISAHIRDEVDLHTSMLGDLESAIDSTSALVNQNRASFAAMIQRSSKRRLTVYIVILSTILMLLLFF